MQLIRTSEFKLGLNGQGVFILFFRSSNEEKRW